MSSMSSLGAHKRLTEVGISPQSSQNHTSNNDGTQSLQFGWRQGMKTSHPSEQSCSPCHKHWGVPPGNSRQEDSRLCSLLAGWFGQGAGPGLAWLQWLLRFHIWEGKLCSLLLSVSRLNYFSCTSWTVTNALQLTLIHQGSGGAANKSHSV